MLHTTTAVDDRIRDLHALAAELRHGRNVNAGRRAGWTTRIRFRTGTVLLAVGAALVNGTHPAAPHRAGR